MINLSIQVRTHFYEDRTALLADKQLKMIYKYQIFVFRSKVEPECLIAGELTFKFSCIQKMHRFETITNSESLILK